MISLLFNRDVMIGFVFDLIDWLIVGLIPFVGYLIDGAAMLYFYRRVGMPALIGAVELVPFAGVLPTWFALGLYSAYKSEAG